MKLFICTLLATVVCHVQGQGLPTGSSLGVVTNGLGVGAQPLASGQPDLSNLKPPSISDLLNAAPLNIVTGGEPTNCNDEDSGSSEVPPKCSSLKLVEVDYEAMKERSPFYVYLSNLVSFNCTQSVYVGPSANRDNYNGTVIVIKAGTTFSVQHEIIAKKIFRAVFCNNGVRGDYRVVYAKFTLRRSSLCVVNCADDGVGYNSILCAGRTPCDEDDIQEFVDTKLKGVPGIVNTQLGCPQPQFCDFFNN